MTDTWAAFNPQPAPDDPWEAFKPEAAAKPMPENGVIDIDRASPFVSSESEAAYSASLPDAFLDRLRRGQALGRVLNEALKGMQEGFGDEPVVGSDAHLDHLLRKLSIDREDSRASPLAIDMVAAGVASMKFPAMAPVRGLAAIVDATMRGINSGLHAGAGGIGQIISELGGDGSGARKEIINFGNFAMIEAGMGRFSRPTVGRIGPGDQPIGGLPKAADFTTSAELLAGAPAETIVSAAIRSPDGRVFPAPTHGHASFLAEDAGADISKILAKDSDGFVTSTGRFVSREEATEIAKRAGQIDHGTGKIESHHTAAPREAGPERVAAAAILYDGKVYTATNHITAWDVAADTLGVDRGAFFDKAMAELHAQFPDDKSGMLNQRLNGFVTSKGRYVDREEAHRIAEGAGQYNEASATSPARARGTLGAEDLVKAPREAGQVGGGAVARDVAATERNLRDLWEERGIHPAEAVHDAQRDAFLRRDITRPSFEVYHGSPHHFERFDLSKRGTGEGNKAFGEGIYLAEHPDVATEYRNKLSVGDLTNPNDVASTYLRTQSDREAAIEALRFNADQFVEGHAVRPEVLRQAADLLESGATPETPGALYKVRILADREHFLDWDKPLSEQSPSVQVAIQELSKNKEVAIRIDGLGGNPKMGQVYGAIGRGITHSGRRGYGAVGEAADAAASQALREAGIPGIKYLDQGSRGAGEFRVREADGKFYVESSGLKDAAGQKFDSREQARAWADAKEREGETSNFVLFDDKLAEITHKNGIALRDLSLEDAIDASQGGGLIARARELGVKTMVAADKVGLTDPDVAWVPAYEAAKLIALGADVTGEVMPTLAQQPPPRPGRLAAAVTATADKLFDIGRDIQMKVAPMATGTRDTMAMAKDFANTLRRNSWEWARIDDDVAGRFTAEQRKRMWDAADEESVARQLGESREHQGLVTLTAEERAAVEDLQSRAQVAWLKAVDLGMVEGEGLPAYTPRFVLNVGNPHAGNGPIPLNGMGTNLRVRTPQMRRRKHMTAEETEAAAKRLVGDRAARELKSLDEINAEMADVQIARDIRALPLATAKLEDAIAGRTMIDKIKEYGKRTGDDTVTEGARPGEGWFTIDHPAFRTWKPKFEEVDGAIRAAKDADGNTIFEQVPIYVRGDFEGTLRAVLTQPSGATYQMFMELKGKTMSMIMNSPMIHNAVEWGRALPAMPGKVVTFRVYFEGNRAKKDVAVMHEAIDGGLVPIGKRFFNQDITSIMEAPDLTPGRSWTAKVLAAVPGLFDEAAGTAVKRAIDKAGDFWHNTLLWDRIGDLQMGLYTNLRDDMLAKGIDRQTAVRAAAHWANRYAGALPQEAMSDAARKVSNVLMFSRSFTLGNLGAMKDMLTGLPKDVLAQIERDAGFSENSLVGYHGTHKVFTEFASEFQGSGVDAPFTAGMGHFFITDPAMASGYAEGTAGAGNVKRAQISLANPLTKEFKDHRISDLAGQDEQLSVMLSRAMDAGNDGVVLKGIGGKEGADLIVAFNDSTIKGLPFGADIKAIDRKAAVDFSKSMARRKAMAIVGLDIALMYVGNSLLQSALNVMVTDRTLGEELHGYAQRFVEKMQSIREHPLELLQPFGFFQSLSATAENEPGRENRIHVGETKDGTAIYARNPSGKIGEEFEGYLTGPLDMIRRKLGTIARPAWQIMSNDAGFGRKIIDPTADTPAKYLKNIGAVIGHLVRSQFPEGQFDAASDLVKGEGDAKLNALQAFGPLVGVTFSKGAPGGPAVGELYHAREMHNFQINAALPDIRKQFQRGDIAEARQRMNELGIPPGLQRFYEDTSINPTTARMRGRTLTDFYRYATPEQRERLDRARIR